MLKINGHESSVLTYFLSIRNSPNVYSALDDLLAGEFGDIQDEIVNACKYIVDGAPRSPVSKDLVDFLLPFYP